MDDKTLVERVIAWLDGGCSSWNVPSSDIRQMATRIEALEAALRRMIYETTHLSPMKPNGDHDCTIKADALEQARQALESQP